MVEQLLEAKRPVDLEAFCLSENEILDKNEKAAVRALVRDELKVAFDEQSTTQRSQIREAVTEGLAHVQPQPQSNSAAAGLTFYGIVLSSIGTIVAIILGVWGLLSWYVPSKITEAKGDFGTSLSQSQTETIKKLSDFGERIARMEGIVSRLALLSPPPNNKTGKSGYYENAVVILKDAGEKK